jgi:putative component of toxin-antitoxin plasmid stabilization module
MKVILKTDVFKKYMKNLKDATAKAHIDRRVNRLRGGNAGDKSTQQADIKMARKLAKEKKKKDESK